MIYLVTIESLNGVWLSGFRAKVKGESFLGIDPTFGQSRFKRCHSIGGHLGACKVEQSQLLEL